MWNEAIIVGNLGKDPEIRSTQDGKKIASFSVATSERWKDKNSRERKERTEWHRVVCFGRLAEVAESYLQKGTTVAVRGAIRTRKWTDQAGADRYSTEIVVDGFDAKLQILKGGVTEDDTAGSTSTATSGNVKRKAKTAEPDPDLDDDIPF